MSQNKGYPIPAIVAPVETRCFKVSVPDERGHRAAFFGAISSLAKWYNWETTNDNTGKLLADVWLGVFNSIVDCEAGFVEIEFKNEDCHLFWREDAESDWIDLGNICGEPGTPGEPGADADCACEAVSSGQRAISQAAVPAFDPLSPDSFDKYCFAAHALAIDYADATADLMEIIRLAIQISAPAIQWAATALVGWIPYFGQVSDETIEFTTEISLAIYTFALSQVQDVDALAFAAEKIFCALRQSYPNFDSMYEYIDFPSEMPALDLIINAIELDAIALIENWDDLIQFAFDTWFTGAAWGWLILAIGELNQKVATLPLAGTAITDVIRTPNKLSIVVPEMMSRSTYFDSRDCAGYDCPEEVWCAEFDLTIETPWHVAAYSDFGSQPFSVYSSGVGFEDIIEVGFPTGTKRRFCHIEIDLPESVTITSIEFDCVVEYSGTSNSLNIRQSASASASAVTDYSEFSNHNGQSGTITRTGTLGGARKLVIAAGVGYCDTAECVPGGSALITRVRLTGIGISPFDEIYNCEI